MKFGRWVLGIQILMVVASVSSALANPAYSIRRETLSAGTESSGGGQVVLDSKTGRVFFNPYESGVNDVEPVVVTRQVFEELMNTIPCTHRIMVPMSETPYGRILENVAYNLAATSDAQIESIAKPMLESLNQNYFYVTAFPLPQLKDAVSVDKRFQIQGAYFEEGNAYFQAQLLAKMDDEQIQHLVIKELIRSINYSKGLNLGNVPLEIAAHKLNAGKTTSLDSSHFFLKLSAPSERDSKIAEIKAKIAELDRKIEFYKERHALRGSLFAEKSLLYLELANLVGTPEPTGIFGKAFGESIKAEVGTPTWLARSRPKLDGVEGVRYVKEYKFRAWNIWNGELEMASPIGSSCQ